jgi:hypothetical protein
MREPLTWDRAAASVGWEGKGRARRLKRLVFAREREKGNRIATRYGKGRKQRTKVSLSALRKHCPELFRSKVEDLADNLKAYLSEIDERIAAGAAQHVAEYVEPRLDELWLRDEKIANQVEALAQRVGGLARVMRT